MKYKKIPEKDETEIPYVNPARYQLTLKREFLGLSPTAISRKKIQNIACDVRVIYELSYDANLVIAKANMRGNMAL